MPKLLQINSNLNSGSAGRIVEQIGELALEKGWESFVVFGRRSNETKSIPIKIGNVISVYLHGLISLLFDKHGLGSSNATKKLLKQIEKIDPDVIHLHGLHGYYINYEILFDFLNKYPKPIVWTMHDFWAITGHCSFFSDIHCHKWEVQCSNCPKTKNYPKSLLFDKSYENFRLKKKLFTNNPRITVVSVSKWMGSLMKFSFLSELRQEIILNGVDIYRFNIINSNRIRDKYKLYNKFILLSVATNWGPRKGWDDLILLSNLLPKEFQIILVGLNNHQLKKIPKNIIGITRTESQEELAELYSSSDVVLSLSSQETFGLTIVEGFACGTPGIVYNSTASPELISPETGFIVEKGNINDLVEAIMKIKLLGKKHFSEKCRERAEKVYDKNLRYMEYINLYNNLVDNKAISIE